MRAPESAEERADAEEIRILNRHTPRGVHIGIGTYRPADIQEFNAWMADLRAKGFLRPKPVTALAVVPKRLMEGK